MATRRDGTVVQPERQRGTGDVSGQDVLTRWRQPSRSDVQVILRALKKYGMILADNGSNWYLSGAPDPRWNDDELRSLRSLRGSDFEVLQMGTIEN